MMKVLILTSKDHLYANLFLRKVFEDHLFQNDQVVIWEQDTIVPGKSPLAGLRKYISIAGWYYVIMQMVKQFLFLLRRLIDQTMKNQASIFFPYWKISGYTGKRQTYGRLKSDEALTRVNKMQPDLIFSVLSKEIIPERILQVPRFGAVNLHPAYLPSYRGVSPILWSLANNEPFVGVTLHRLDVGIDTGGIIARKKVTVSPSRSEHSLYLRLVEEGCLLFKEYYRNFQHGKLSVVQFIKSPEKTSYFSLPTKEAVKRLRQNGYVLFSLSELLS
jgi:folate-dependent phosphoribosylglycinamide formyltransferase PurN